MEYYTATKMIVINELQPQLQQYSKLNEGGVQNESPGKKR
jgi:hypothetical protein